MTTWAPSSTDSLLFEQFPSARALNLNVMMLHEILGNLVLWLRPSEKR